MLQYLLNPPHQRDVRRLERENRELGEDKKRAKKEVLRLERGAEVQRGRGASLEQVGTTENTSFSSFLSFFPPLVPNLVFSPPIR
jgi:hypothetical protein